MAKNNMQRSTIDWIAWILVIIGSLNWGLIAINSGWNVVEALFGAWPVVMTLIYALVGLSGLWVLWKLFQ